MRTDYSALIRDLERLRQQRPPQAALQPPLPESEIVRFETEHGITLPQDYREFLLSVANGGAGPGDGVNPLGTAYGMSWGESPGLVGDLAMPFPCSEAWNDSPVDGSLSPEEQYRQQDRYWSSQHVSGALPICHLGCNLRQLLIVTGPERGHVWYDDCADWQGLYPDQSDSGARLTFIEWYRRWLDGCLRH